ncbi:hypothetical protein CCYA_CCYA02G0489 [Cyanidiococcus yangmingshanensis]|nr:hypothetical protein CCYA_CCYA02G0489 [Cyanidiococcus yangmingshanensis]
MSDSHREYTPERAYPSDVERGNVFGSSPSELHSLYRLGRSRHDSDADALDSDVAVDEDARGTGLAPLGMFRGSADPRSSDIESALDEDVHGDEIDHEDSNVDEDDDRGTERGSDEDGDLDATQDIMGGELGLLEDDEDDDDDDDDDDEGDDDDDDDDDDAPSDEDEDHEYAQFAGVQQEMLSLMEQRGAAWMDGMPASHLQALRRADIQAQRLMQRFRNADEDMEVFVVWRSGQEAGEVLAELEEDASLSGRGLQFMNVGVDSADWAEGFGLGMTAANAMFASDPSSEALRPYAPVRMELPQPPRIGVEQRPATERNLSVASTVLDGLGSRRHGPGATIGNILLYGSGARCRSCPRSAREALSGLCRSDGLRSVLGSDTGVAPSALVMRRNLSSGDCGLRDATDAYMHDLAELLLRSPVYNEILGHGMAAAFLTSKVNQQPKESDWSWELPTLATVLAGVHLHPLFWDSDRFNSPKHGQQWHGSRPKPVPMQIRLSDDLLEALLGFPLGPLIGLDRFGTLAVTGTRQRRRDVLRLHRAFRRCTLRRGAPFEALSGLDTLARHPDSQQKSCAGLHEEMRALWRDERVRRERAQLDEEYRRQLEEEAQRAPETRHVATEHSNDTTESASQRAADSVATPVEDISLASAGPSGLNELDQRLVGSETTWLDANRRGQLPERLAHSGYAMEVEEALLDERALEQDTMVDVATNLDADPEATAYVSAIASASSSVADQRDASGPAHGSQTDDLDTAQVARAVGIDPTVLVELPPDLRREVIQQHLVQIRNSTAFMNCLPAHIQQEVEEATSQMERLRGSATDMDNGSFLATLPPALREEIYLTSDESFLQTLPPHLAAEARAIRDRRRPGATAAFLLGSDLLPPTSTMASVSSPVPELTARQSAGLPLISRLDVLEKALRSPGVCSPLLANTVRLLCYDTTTRLRIVRLTWQLLECQRAEDASAAGRSAELAGSLLRFSPTIALDLVAAEGERPLVHLLQSIPKAVRHGGRHRHRLVEVLITTTCLYVQVLRGSPSSRGTLLEPAQPDAVVQVPLAPPRVDEVVLEDLAMALQVPDLSVRSWERLLAIYEYLYGEEMNRETVIRCLIRLGTSLIGPVCEAIREEPGLRVCETLFVQTVQTTARLLRPHLERLQALNPVWNCLEEQLTNRETLGPPVRLSRLIECYLQAHSVRIPDLLADMNRPRTALPADTARTTTLEMAPGSNPPPSGSSLDALVDHDAVLSVDRALSRFMERHAYLINQLLQMNPALFRHGFQSTLLHARFLDFENKKVFFRHVIQEQRRSSRQPPVRLLVRRDCVFEDSYHQLRPRNPAELRGTLTVQFVGEEGIDAGGLVREWYVILARKIFDENYALFRRCVGKSGAYHINECSYVNEDHLGFFKFIGRFIGKALWDGQLLDAYFARSVYKHMIGLKPSYHDIEAIDPEYYASLVWMLENNIAHVLDLTMSAELDQFGELKVVDLVPNGRQVPVTEENKWEYVRLITELKMTKAIEQQLSAFLEGFHELVPPSLIAMFSDYELELLISGLPEIDIADLKIHTTYSGYRPSSPQIQWFWQAVAEMDRDDRARLVMFVTGSSKVPLGGFANLPGMNGGVQRFQIHRVAGDTDRLPSAHTCFNQLDLPEYSTYEKMRERLLTAIREGNEGFGFG